MPLWGILDLEFQTFWGNFAMEFEKNISVFEINIPELKL